MIRMSSVTGTGFRCLQRYSPSSQSLCHPHDLTGKWVRTSPTQGFNNVPETGPGNFPHAPAPPGVEQPTGHILPRMPRADAVGRTTHGKTCDPLGVTAELYVETCPRRTGGK